MHTHTHTHTHTYTHTHTAQVFLNLLRRRISLCDGISNTLNCSSILFDLISLCVYPLPCVRTLALWRRRFGRKWRQRSWIQASSPRMRGHCPLMSKTGELNSISPIFYVLKHSVGVARCSARVCLCANSNPDPNPNVYVLHACVLYYHVLNDVCKIAYL